MIDRYLNIRNLNHTLSDAEFDTMLPTLVKELADIPISIQHSEEKLRSDYKKLTEYVPNGELHVTSKIGMKLCEHFFPNIYDVESKGKSFRQAWSNPAILERVLKWNRKSHSTPYLSELKRGIYFCGAITKPTMYRPQLANSIVSYYTPNIVLDPCAGWGGRLLGTVTTGASYIGFEPNTQTYNNTIRMVDFLGISKQVTLINDSVENIHLYDFPTPGLILTSPPYFDLEIYSDEDTQSHVDYDTYEDWKIGFLNKTIENCISRMDTTGVSCWNVRNYGKMKMVDDVRNKHIDLGCIEDRSFDIFASSRPRNGRPGGSLKDSTICYKRI